VLRSGRSVFVRVGSNPTDVKLFFRFLLPIRSRDPSRDREYVCTDFTHSLIKKTSRKRCKGKHFVELCYPRIPKKSTDLNYPGWCQEWEPLQGSINSIKTSHLNPVHSALVCERCVKTFERRNNEIAIPWNHEPDLHFEQRICGVLQATSKILMDCLQAETARFVNCGQKNVKSRACNCSP
jgi:hypothetical protein